jgi:hypothetical protein
MTLRRSTVEHPFGTIKAWMGSTHFLMRRLKNVRIEMALNVLAYNIKWIAPIGWSSLSVNACSVSGLSASCFLARADGSAAHYAV